MASVQFWNIDDAIDGFDRTGCQIWAIKDGRRLIFKGSGKDELREWLDLMNGTPSRATYTLAYFSKMIDADDVNDKTAYDGSFNFKLQDPAEVAVRGGYVSGYGGGNSALYSKIAALEAKVDDLLKGQTSEEPENRLGIIGEIISHPVIAPMIPLIIEKIASLLTIQPAEQAPPIPNQLRKVSGITASADIDQDRLIREAIPKLKAADSRLGEHLSKLAGMAENDPNSFGYILKMLDQMPG